MLMEFKKQNTAYATIVCRSASEWLHATAAVVV